MNDRSDSRNREPAHREPAPGPIERRGDAVFRAAVSSADGLSALLADQHRRWNAGERLGVEAYIDAVPRLIGASDDLLVLSLSEVRLRQSIDESPILSEYQKRFPQLAEQLARQWELERLLRDTISNRERTLSIHAEPISNDTTIQVDENSNPPADPTLAVSPEQASAEAAARDGPIGRFGDYELIEEIARGGMGVVYKARQVRLNRVVALKMIIAGQLAGEEEVRRFQAEAEAAANLDHPGIVPIYEVGQVKGQHYFSMAYVDGISLSEMVAKGPLDPRDAARIVKTLCEAIAYAHSKGVVHRDLKPSNVLLARESGDNTAGLSAVGSGGSTGSSESGSRLRERFLPKITDFGLAKRTQDDRGMTVTGQILGTPSYMPPEQAAGRIDQVTEKSDIYSLGAILYCLITGRPPFQCSRVMDTLMEVLDKDPPPPRLLNGRIDADIEAICLKCLEKDQNRRYQTADALAADLNSFIEGDSISIGSVNLVSSLARTLARSKYDVAFASWGAMLLWFAAIVFAAELATFAQGFGGNYVPLVHALPVRGVQFVLLVAVAWAYRRDWMQRGAMERQMWATWAGFVVACHLAVFACWIMLPEDQPFHYFACYPYFAMFSGMMFFVYGGSHWGACFLLGAIFFALSALMPLHLQWAPLEFGAVWGASLALIGWRLKTIANDQKRESAN